MPKIKKKNKNKIESVLKFSFTETLRNSVRGLARAKAGSPSIVLEAYIK